MADSLERSLARLSGLARAIDQKADDKPAPGLSLVRPLFILLALELSQLQLGELKLKLKRQLSKSGPKSGFGFTKFSWPAEFGLLG